MAVVQRVVVVQGLVQNIRLSQSRFSRARDLGWSLLTGGYCSEVVVNGVGCLNNVLWKLKILKER